MKVNPLDISTSFSSIISSIINTNASNLFSIECNVMLPDNTVIHILPEEIEKLTIDQNFYSNYRDIVEIEVDIKVETYKTLVRNRQNLRFNLCVFSMNVGDTITTRSKAVKYMGIIKDQEEPTLRSPDKALDNAYSENGGITKTLKVTFELIPEHIYRVRKSKFNFILNNATMQETIMFIADMLGFTNVYFVKPDNETRYDNVVVPPLLELSDIFSYLQESPAYGVYNGGMNYYVCNDILYILPLFNNLKNGPQFNIYNAGDGGYASANSYHRVTDVGVDIVNVHKIIVASDTQSVVENSGNSYIINTPKKHIVNPGILIADNIYKVDKDFLTNVILYDDMSGINKKAFTQSYVVTDNLHQVYAALTANSIFTIGFVWSHAYPFMVTPNSNVNFISDGEKQLQKNMGWCNSIKYTFVKTKTIDIKTFACKADVVIGLLTAK